MGPVGVCEQKGNTRAGARANVRVYVYKCVVVELHLKTLLETRESGRAVGGQAPRTAKQRN